MDKLLLKEPEALALLSMRPTQGRAWLRENGCRVCYGRSVFYDRRRIEEGVARMQQQDVTEAGGA